MTRIQVTHFNDPGCPWGYSANPALRVLEWRYGAQLQWRHVMIGLAENPQLYVDRGYTPLMMASGWIGFRRYGMPFAPQAKVRIAATSPACRAVVAARLAGGVELEERVFRALQFAQFTSPVLLDEPTDLHLVLGDVEGVDADAIVGAIDTPEVWAAYEADRAETRSAAGGAGALQGKTFDSDGAERYTAPSLLFTRGELTLEATGMQPVEAYDVLVANLDPALERRAAPTGDVAAVLAAFPHGLVTGEVAAVLTAGNDPVDRPAAERLLVELVASGAASRTALGDDALWRLVG